MNEMYEQEQRQYAYGGVETLNNYVSKTFGWMFGGLALTAAVAFLGYASGLTWNLLLSGGTMFLLLITIAELGVVMYLSARIHAMQVGTARALFFAYSALNGLVFSMYFFLFELSSMALAFVAAAAYFGLMAVYGHFTKRDLTSWGRMLSMGLIALLVVGMFSMLFGFGFSGVLYSALGIALFLGLTAYDTQKLKDYYFAFGGNSEMAAKASIFGALNLYLDFINIFLFVLRLVGRNRD